MKKALLVALALSSWANAQETGEASIPVKKLCAGCPDTCVYLPTWREFACPDATVLRMQKESERRAKEAERNRDKVK